MLSALCHQPCGRSRDRDTAVQSAHLQKSTVLPMAACTGAKVEQWCRPLTCLCGDLGAHLIAIAVHEAGAEEAGPAGAGVAVEGVGALREAALNAAAAPRTHLL